MREPLFKVRVEKENLQLNIGKPCLRSLLNIFREKSDVAWKAVIVCSTRVISLQKPPEWKKKTLTGFPNFLNHWESFPSSYSLNLKPNILIEDIFSSTFMTSYHRSWMGRSLCIGMEKPVERATTMAFSWKLGIHLSILRYSLVFTGMWSVNHFTNCFLTLFPCPLTKHRRPNWAGKLWDFEF